MKRKDFDGILMEMTSVADPAPAARQLRTNGGTAAAEQTLVAGRFAINLRGLSKAVPKWANGNCLEWHDTNPGKPQQNRWIRPFNGSLRDEGLNKAIFDGRVDTRRKLALRRSNHDPGQAAFLAGQQNPG